MKKIIYSIISFIIFLLTPSVTYAATFGLQPNTGTFNRGCIIGVKIMLDAQGGQTDGSDAILIYDPSKLTVTTSNIVNGTIYNDYPGNSVDSSAGKVSISGISSVSVPFSGSGEFALVNFTVNQNAGAGTTQIKFDFDPNDKTKTIDSNIIERGTIADLLSSVTDGTYTIATGNGCSNNGSGTGTGTGSSGSGSGTGSGTGSYQVLNPGRGAVGANNATPSATKYPVIDNMVGGPAGILDNTLTLSVIGVALTIIGIAGLALL